jgi:hypothetical protein
MDPVSPCVIAIRLADEGVPLRAIARATSIPSGQLYETLTIAKLEGRLLSLPRDDWPPGCPRDQRSLQLSRMAAEDRGSLMLAIQKLFELPAQPAELLLLLVQHENVPHARIDVDRKVCAVYVCTMRQSLLKHGLKIKTIWGYGYLLSQEHRRKAMDLILSRVALP